MTRPAGFIFIFIFKICTLGYRIIGGVGIILAWVENQRFNRPKTKNYITEGKIISRKLISGGDDYSVPESNVYTEKLFVCQFTSEKYNGIMGFGAGWG